MADVATKRGGDPAVLGGAMDRAIKRAMEASRWASDEEVARYEARRERERRMDLVWGSGVADVLTPEMIEALVDDRLERTEALEWTRRWVTYQRGTVRPRGPRPILALVGGMGRGKTVAAGWLVLHESARYIEADEVLRLASARWGADLEAWRRLQRQRVLVIDEVGVEPDKHAAAAAYRELLNKRLGHRLTLLLGNLSKKDLRARLDLRTVDRLRERGQIIELEGESLREGDEL